MAQLIYSVLALLLIMFLSMNMQRNVGRDQQEQSVNEVGTQLTGVGTEVLEYIGSRHFDHHAWNYEWSRRGVDKSGTAVPSILEPYCGRLSDDLQQYLSHPDPSNAASHHGDCSTLANPYEDCPYIEGFEGIPPFTITRDEFDYEVTVVDVEYVDPNDFSSPPPGGALTSFAKKVTISVSNPFLYLGDDSNNTFQLDLERVFTYGCLSDPDLIPYVLSGDYCPSDPSNPSGSNRPLPCSRW